MFPVRVDDSSGVCINWCACVFICNLFLIRLYVWGPSVSLCGPSVAQSLAAFLDPLSNLFMVNNVFFYYKEAFGANCVFKEPSGLPYGCGKAAVAKPRPKHRRAVSAQACESRPIGADWAFWERGLKETGT